jgi:MFS family permease
MLLLTDRFERKYLIFADTVVWFAGLTLFALRLASTVMLGSFLASTALGMYLQVAYTYTAENFPTRAKSSGFALTDGIGHVGGALGAIFLSVLVLSHSFFTGFEFIAITDLLAGTLALLDPRSTGAHVGVCVRLTLSARFRDGGDRSRPLEARVSANINNHRGFRWIGVGSAAPRGTADGRYRAIAGGFHSDIPERLRPRRNM